MVKIPDFFIIGAQKSGTTSLAGFLDGLPGVCFARPKEPMFFSRDEAALHPHFFAEQPQQWVDFDWANRRDELLEYYRNYFRHGEDGDLWGEGSTSYLLSHHAPRRIARLNPHAKIIVVLRDPAKRAYSAYWHYVRGGIAVEPFDKHLRYEGGMTLRAGEYALDIARWLKYFPRDQFLFILTEEMVSNAERVVSRLGEFLEIETPRRPTLSRQNSGQTPGRLWLQLWLNRAQRAVGTPHAAIGRRLSQSALSMLLKRLSRWNMSDLPPPHMPHALHKQLDIHYKRMNAELEGMTGVQVRRYWYETLN